MLEFKAPLIAVKDIEQSKKFYCELFDQTVVEDYGRNVTLSGGFSLQQDFDWLLGFPKETVLYKTHNTELYFETESFDEDIEKLEKDGRVTFLHLTKTADWGQRSARVYDPDFHIIEIGEPMSAVVLRMLKQGKSTEETMKITMQTKEFVESCASEI